LKDYPKNDSGVERVTRVDADQTRLNRLDSPMGKGAQSLPHLPRPPLYSQMGRNEAPLLPARFPPQCGRRAAKTTSPVWKPGPLVTSSTNKGGEWRDFACHEEETHQQINRERGGGRKVRLLPDDADTYLRTRPKKWRRGGQRKKLKLRNVSLVKARQYARAPKEGEGEGGGENEAIFPERKAAAKTTQ